MGFNAEKKPYHSGSFGSSSTHNTGRFTCDTCNKRFIKPCLLRRHEVIHLTEKPFECSECRKRFTQSSSLQRHYAAQHNSNNKRYQCIKCPLSFRQKGNLRQHDKKVHPLEVAGKAKSFEHACDKCACVYRNKQKLSRHKNTVHSDTNLGGTNLEQLDDLALTQSILKQLKTFQAEMQLTMPTTESTENVEMPMVNQTTQTVNNDEVLLQQHIDKPLMNEVRLRDRLNEQGTAVYLRVQRTVCADGSPSYVCEYCKKAFRKPYDFLRHRRVHTRERPYKCAFCQWDFSTKTKLQEHVKIHRLDEHTGVFTKHYPCAVCDETFSAVKLLDMHMSTHAETYKVKYICKICEATFNTSRGLCSHKHARVNENLKFLQQLLPTPIEVSDNARATTNTNFRQPTKTRQIEINCKCLKCDRLFSNSSVLRQHQRVYHGTFGHKRCVFNSPTTMRCFKCVYCMRHFKYQSHCKVHMLSHLRRLLNSNATSQVQEKQMSCIPSVVNALVVVVDTATKTTIKVVQFNVISPKTKSRLPKAPKTRSPVTVRHKCHICSSKFKKLCDLKRHLVIHSGERSYECFKCGKCFSLSSTLKQHQLTHATERQKHVCIVCGKSYATKKSLNVHLRLHTGVQPFNCDHCELKFRTSGQRIAHLKVVHRLHK